MVDPMERPQGEMPSFTGDVPADAVASARLVGRRYLRQLRMRSRRISLTCGTAFVMFVATASLTQVRPAWLDPSNLPVTIGAAVVAVLSGVGSFVRRIPAVVRYVLGVVPGACGLFVGMGVDPDGPGAGWSLPAFVGGVGATLAFIVIAVIRVRSWAERELAQIEAGLSEEES